MRCFIGLPLPEDYQRLLAGLLQEWKTSLGPGVSWTRPGNWHLTLKFLGEMQESRVSSLRNALGMGLSEEKSCRPFSLQGRGAGFFPNSGRPRVFWVGLGKGGEQTRVLADWVDAACTALGFAKEERMFHPHLTVARIKQSRKDHHGTARCAFQETGNKSASIWADVLHTVAGISWPEIIVDRIVLWESRLSEKGPCYRPQAEWNLRREPWDNRLPSI